MSTRVRAVVLFLCFVSFLFSGFSPRSCIVTGSRAGQSIQHVPKIDQSIDLILVFPPSPASQYAQAISSVGSILEYYDSDKRFPVLGFGGCPVPNSPALHCFAVNGREDDPEVLGIDSILDVYRCEAAPPRPRRHRARYIYM